ncbi:MAG: hypothetical protein HZA50_15350 [Planctomycetes bacterium]|nr:hypothetical protein [Planctomycetota bacterium]
MEDKEMQRFVKELSQRTDWELKAEMFQFFLHDGYEKVPENSIFFLGAIQDIGGHFLIHVTPESIRIDVASGQGYTEPVDALLNALIEKDGKFFWPVGTIKPQANKPAIDKNP